MDQKSFEAIIDLEKIIYLDHAATSYPKPGAIFEQMVDLYSRYGVNPGRSGGDLQRLANSILETTREQLSDAFGSPLAERVILTPNATTALNMAILGLLQPGNHVITSITEHNSVIRPLHWCSENRDVEITWLEPDSRGLLDPEQIREAARPSTRAVVLSHASNVTGTVQPLEILGETVQDLGLFFIVDAAQTAGLFPISMKDAHIDALAITGHKSLLAPAGSGALILSENCDPAPLMHGGTGVNSFSPQQPERYPYRLEAGTANLPAIAGLSKALDLLADSDQRAKRKYLDSLLRRLVTGLREIPGLSLHGYEDSVPRTAVINFTVESMEPETVATFLDVDYNIVCRTGLHCAPLIHNWLGTGEMGSIRLSLGATNTERDVDATIKAIQDITA